LNEGFSTETFFSEVRSSRGNTCGQVFLGVKSGYTVFIPLKSKAYAYVAYLHVQKRFWDYACEYITELINHYATRWLDWRTPYESLHGEIPDISVFCYFFYEPIYYMDPSLKFPQHNMLPGRFLGIARTTGDNFTFIVVQEDRLTGHMLHRSVIHK